MSMEASQTYLNKYIVLKSLNEFYTVLKEFQIGLEASERISSMFGTVLNGLKSLEQF